MKNKGISIIIPCYNVEKYIVKCLDSIQKQNLKEYEIILVDDCSKDKTVKIIEDYLKTNKTQDIKFLKNEVNSGAGYSRNRAVKEAKYDILSFIDSDDYIEDNFYEALLTKMEKENADIVVCDIHVRGDILSYRTQALEGEDKKYNYINNGLAASPCNKLIKKELVEKYPFAEGMMNEDIPMVISSLVYAKKIAYTQDTFYNYVQHEESVQNVTFSDKRFDIFKAINILKERIEGCEDFENIWDAIVYQQIIMFFVYVMPREKRFFTRIKNLRKFHKLSKKLNMRKNPLFSKFLSQQSRKHKYYYSLILGLNDRGLSFLTSLFIWLYDTYKKIFLKPVINKKITVDDIVVEAENQSKKTCDKTISVVIPNYNYQNYLLERLYSVLYQTYKINEIIILDDCSTDDSRELIDKIEKKIGKYVTIKKAYNKENSGNVFKQWEKGFELASSDYVWIAEADDYCKKDFVKANMDQISKDKDIVISYANTGFIDKVGGIISKSVIPEIDVMHTKHWNKNYIIDGVEEIKNYTYLNCTIANVSSVIFKNGDYKDAFEEARKYKQVGDWKFYLKMYEKGKISFIRKTMNYYRIHGNNVTTVTKKQLHFDEIKKIHDELDKKYKFNNDQKKQIKDRNEYLKNQWKVK